jgi:hypothetical protein
MENDCSEEAGEKQPEQPISGLLAGKAWEVHGVRAVADQAMAGS